MDYSRRGLVALTLALTAVVIAPDAHGAEQIGVSAAVRGNVDLIQQGQTPRKAKSGLAVYFEEAIKSGADSGMQLMLLDKTTFTVGPDSEIVIDEMVYDPAGSSSLAVSVAQGAFRYLSGEIGKNNPENVIIRTSSGSIGIRGTNLFSTMVDGQRFFGLLGPGPNNNTGDKAGGFVFENAQGTSSVTRPGYGFSVATGQAPGSVGPIPPALFAKFNSAMAKTPPASSDDNGDNGEQQQGEQRQGEQQQGEQAPPPGEGGKGKGGNLALMEKQSGQNEAEATITAVTLQITRQTQNKVAATITEASKTDLGTNFTVPDGVYIPLTVDDVRSFLGLATYAKNAMPIVHGVLPEVSAGAGLTGADIAAFKDGYAAAISRGEIIGQYSFSAVVDFSRRTIDPVYTGISTTGLAGGNDFSSHIFDPGVFSYANASGSAILTSEPKINNIITGVNLEAGMAFVKSNAAKPSLAQVLVMTNPGGNDIAYGGAIIPAP